MRQVIEDYFAAVDAQDGERLRELFAPRVAFRYANNPPADSPDEILGGLQHFWGAVDGSTHNIVSVYEVDGGAVAEIDATYNRPDGSSVSAPALTIFEFDGDQAITGLRVFTDVGPVFA